MALIACEECGKSISDRATSCPHCGLPLSPVVAVAAVQPSAAHSQKANTTISFPGDDTDVRAGIQQSKVGDTGLQILSFECFVIAAVAGVGIQSWGADENWEGGAFRMPYDNSLAS